MCVEYLHVSKSQGGWELLLLYNQESEDHGGAGCGDPVVRPQHCVVRGPCTLLVWFSGTTLYLISLSFVTGGSLPEPASKSGCPGRCVCLRGCFEIC